MSQVGGVYRLFRRGRGPLEGWGPLRLGGLGAASSARLRDCCRAVGPNEIPAPGQQEGDAETPEPKVEDGQPVEGHRDPLEESLAQQRGHEDEDRHAEDHIRQLVVDPSLLWWVALA